MASPPSPRSQQPWRSAATEPSPALSAYSYTSSASSESDFDLNSLKLLDESDDTPTSTHKKHTPAAGNRSLYSLLHVDRAGSGASTPVPGSLSRSSTGHVRRYLEEKGAVNAADEGEIDRELDEQDDEVENELDGFDVEDEDEDDMHANGVPAARGWRLNAREADTAEFRQTVLALFSEKLEIDTWSPTSLDPAILPLQAENVQLKRISGAFSNAVFFVSYKNDTEKSGPKTVLLRVYGTGTEALLSRRAELLILHTLSSLYEIGPHILGTFANGRVETFFDAEPIGKEGIRDLGNRVETMQEDGSLLVKGREGRAQWVARRMRQLHEVPLETMRTVLEQGDLRVNGDSGSVYGRGVENHLFAKSHRPRLQSRAAIIDPSRMMRESPAPMAESPAPLAEESTDLLSTAAEGARSEFMAIRGNAAHRNNSVASFDSLATSYNSQDSLSVASASNENLLMSSPAFGPTTRSYRSSPLNARAGRSSSFSRANAVQPYPGMWRRSKRWAREAAKVLALVDEFGKTSIGKEACRRALKGTPLENHVPFSPFDKFDPSTRTHSLELGTTILSLRKTLLAIAAIDFPRLLEEMDTFKKYVRRWERRHGASRRVLAHGDTQYSNLLLIKEGALEEEKAGKGMPRERSRDESNSSASERVPSKPNGRRLAPYERLIVIDFEYCSPNPRAYDIANAFHEWRFDYHHPVDCWSPYHLPYPTREERRRWLRAYVEQGRLLRMRGKAPKSANDALSHGIATPSPTPSDALSGQPPVLPPEEQIALPPSVLQRETSSDHSTPTKAQAQAQRGASAHLSSALDSGIPSPMMTGRTSLAGLEASIERELDRLDREVKTFSPACHINWCLWGITFAKETIETLLRGILQGKQDGSEDGEGALGEEVIAGSAESFDNLRYSLSRIELMRQEFAALNITSS